MYVLGIDIGTQGVRGLAVDKYGCVIAGHSTPFAEMNISTIENHKEQDAHIWWEATLNTINEIVNGLIKKNIDPEAIIAIALDGTSGTIVPLNHLYSPLCNGLMYNDGRSAEEAVIVQEKGFEIALKLGYRFNSSYALPKILWIKKHRPDIYDKIHLIVHQSDYIVGRLTGCYHFSDYSNALKTGYDLIEQKWPDFIEKDLEIELKKLPTVLSPGTKIGYISDEAAKSTGLSIRTKVIAGATDGYASAIASGAVEPGDFNTSIGTTLTIKGVVNHLIKDEKGRVYCHLHPEGYWMPGGASNTGGKCLNARFDPVLFDAYNQHVEQKTPTDIVVYPLVGKGERFPFVQPDAEAFMIGNSRNDKELYAALMEGVAYTERLSYDLLAALGCEIKDRLFITGGAVKSKEWSQIRANVMNKTLLKPEIAEPAMGSAIIAASQTMFTDITEAAKSMVRIGETIYPQPHKVKKYNEKYRIFLEECHQRGYI
ncbi:FGGY-family carbohydrate kinase [Geosporobacter ferrireducens]|uniref:Carbohydrate kinase n=1 Tax=Geosporobacter ferrireducens TaxID=1424294 RepID=A0A1D8GP32_9FIRM|nr:FGGY-family carbohydrate kinase [Geosporobacter ferrireducens]AOT72638.1 hypothetical protein Gferi_25630 [Geosporobacter ferrireducens]MTI55040.1 hypothetical protein [Geosporobacter ferrireducens]